MENNIINDDKLEIEDYLPTKTQLQLECGTIGVYLNLKSEDGALYILIYILNFCEDKKDRM